MELDFSKKIKELLALSEAAKRGGPKSSAQTPAKPSEKKKGSNRLGREDKKEVKV